MNAHTISVLLMIIFLFLAAIITLLLVRRESRWYAAHRDCNCEYKQPAGAGIIVGSLFGFSILSALAAVCTY